MWTLRAVSALAHGAIVVLTALIARTLGGDRTRQSLAAGAAAACPFLLGVASLFSTSTFDALAWTALTAVLVKLVATREPRWWLAFGAVLGVALEVKWLPMFLAISFVIAVLVTPDLRAHLRTRWPWLGAAITIVLFGPNLAWQAAHGWPTIEFTRNNNAKVAADQGRVGFVLLQAGLLMFLLPVAVTGFVWLWRRVHWRALAITTAVLFVVLLVVGAKVYYFAGIYPLLLAAGAVAIRPARRRLTVAAAVASAIAAALLLMPLLPQRTMAKLDASGEMKEEMGWPEFADQVAAVYRTLPADTYVLSGSYGEASELQHYGPSRGIPHDRVLSAQNSYADWWPDGLSFDNLVLVRYDPGFMARYCDQTEVVARVTNPFDAGNEARGTPIVVCRGVKVRGNELRENLRHYE